MEGTERTKGVETLLGNPKKAVLAMSIPLIIAMIAQSANNLIDAVWVAGLGSSALAAVGFVFPLFFIIIGVGNGLGVGTSSAIARHIGRNDKASADAAATQGLMMAIVGGAVVTVLILIFLRPIMMALGAGDTIDDCVNYAFPIFLSTIIFLINAMLSNLLRAEGDAKRSMNTQILSAGINIILDPLFIYDYGLGLGIAGAAWATVIAVLFPLALMLYWFFIKKDTYIKISRKNMRFNKAIDKDILRVGIPASMEMMLMSVFSMLMNMIIVLVGGTDNVAVYSSTWRLIQMLMIPLMAIGGAIVPVCAAAYGARRYDKVKEAYKYSLKICVVIMVILTVLAIALAEYLVIIFTYNDSTAYLKDNMVLCLRIVCPFLPFASWGFVASGLFQAVGMGVKSFVCTLVRNGLQIPACYIVAITIATFSGVMWAILITEIIGSIVAGIWSVLVLRALLFKYRPPSFEIEDDDKKANNI
jgi:putative MATE family efflux protein